MINCWKDIYTLLIASTSLKTKLSYTAEYESIFRGWDPKDVLLPCLSFRQDSSAKEIPEVTGLKRLVFIFSAFHLESDSFVQEVQEILETILDNKQVQGSNSFMYDISFDGYIGGPYYDESNNWYVCRSRYIVLVRA